MRIPVLFVSLLLAATPLRAADPPVTAIGTFRSEAITLDAKSAVAFRGKSLADGTDALVVAVSNLRLNPDAIANYVDRRRVIETRIRGGESGIVYFEFTPDGKYRGMSYAFGPGNGCGYCAGEVASTVALVNGRLSGKLAATQKDRALDITLVTPVMSDEHGAALPADGGAPGKAYLAYHEALAKADRAALKPLLSKDQQQYWDDNEKAGKLGGMIHAMATAHPVKGLQINGGFATADKAVLLITGEASAGTIVGEALLLKEGDAWRVDDELTEPVGPQRNDAGSPRSAP